MIIVVVHKIVRGATKYEAEVKKLNDRCKKQRRRELKGATFWPLTPPTRNDACIISCRRWEWSKHNRFYFSSALFLISLLLSFHFSNSASFLVAPEIYPYSGLCDLLCCLYSLQKKLGKVANADSFNKKWKGKVKKKRKFFHLPFLEQEMAKIRAE